jgi:hypothetical protein
MNVLNFFENNVSSLFSKSLAAMSPNPVVQDAVPYKGQYVQRSREKPNTYRAQDSTYNSIMVRPKLYIITDPKIHVMIAGVSFLRACPLVYVGH